MAEIRFRNGDQEFVARGDDSWKMQVFEVVDGELCETKMLFPSCLKFMPYAEEIVGEVDDNE